MLLDKLKAVGCVLILITFLYIILLAIALTYIYLSMGKSVDDGRKDLVLTGIVENIKEVEGASSIVDLKVITSNTTEYDKRCIRNNKHYFGLIQDEKASFVFDMDFLSVGDTVKINNGYWVTKDSLMYPIQIFMNTTFIYERKVNPYFNKKYGKADCE